MILPVDQHIPEVLRALERGGALVLVAEPGAGKTTRVPPALFAAGWRAEREIVVLEPRRLAARLAARRVAAERGEPVGANVGYRVRFEDVTGPGTRLVYMTEAILARRLADDPRLDAVAAIVIDEFHERSVHADLALAFAARLRATARADLRVVVMSATLDAEPVARFLGAPVLALPGRPYPVAIEHDETNDVRPLERRVAAAVRRAAAESAGDVLVFLPGAAEIRRAARELEPPADEAGWIVAPLHGDLPADEQDRAIAPATRRKVILATNVAETSITVEGVGAVVDSGLARRAGHSPWSGLPTLELAPISQSSAAQRAGRAGRTGPGRCLRLYTRYDLSLRDAHDPPEIGRADLAEAVLALAAAGERDPRAFPWFEPPPAAALDAARELLARLGAIDGAGEVTARGRELACLPVHPRAGALLLAAAESGAARRGALVAALAGERDVRPGARTAFGESRPAPPAASGPSDLLAQLDALEPWIAGGARAERARTYGLDSAAATRVARGAAQLERALRARRRDSTPADDDGDEALLRATLAAFPDRVGRRREPGSPAVVFAGGGSATLSDNSVVRGAEWLVAVDAEERRDAGVLVWVASAIEPAWLVEMFPERIEERAEIAFDRRTGRVESGVRWLYGSLAVVDQRDAEPRGPAVEAALREAALAAGPAAFDDPAALAACEARAAFARAHGADVPAFAEVEQRELLAALCAGRRSFAELREAGLVSSWLAGIAPAARAALERVAPERVELASGRRARVEYVAGQPPFVAAFLQDFFGAVEGPRLAAGREPLVLHLLAPNRRPVQVTTDLAGFWERHYPALRRQLMRRYPRHAWPADPRSGHR